MTEKSTKRKLMIVSKKGQKSENFIMFKDQDKHLAKNLVAKRAMAAELAEMGQDRATIARLLNLEKEKED